MCSKEQSENKMVDKSKKKKKKKKKSVTCTGKKVVYSKENCQLENVRTWLNPRFSDEKISVYI